MPADPASIDPASILPRVIDAAVEAGNLVAAEFARPEGPRFSDNVTAPLDHEIEMLLRDRLLALIGHGWNAKNHQRRKPARQGAETTRYSFDMPYNRTLTAFEEPRP